MKSISQEVICIIAIPSALGKILASARHASNEHSNINIKNRMLHMVMLLLMSCNISVKGKAFLRKPSTHITLLLKSSARRMSCTAGVNKYLTIQPHVRYDNNTHYKQTTSYKLYPVYKNSMYCSV